MKLLGFHNTKQVVASIAKYDYRSAGEGENYILMDGGQDLDGHGWYGQCWGKPIWIMVPQTMAELYNDWNLNKPRKYGLWNLEDVSLLSPEEIPDTESFEWQAENAIWGTNGPDGKSLTTYVLLKDCELDHLEKISKICDLRRNGELKKIVDYWIDKKTYGI